MYWISFLMWVYVVDIPSQASFWQMSTLFAMLCVMSGAKPLTGIALPAILGTMIGGLLYVFVMPHLSGYGQLGLLLFALVFAFAYRFSEPYQVGLKAAFIANAVSTMSIQNEQSYSFAGFANSLIMTILVSALLVAVFYIPPSPRPEKVFVRLYRRFFRHAEHLISRPAGFGWGFQGIAWRWRAAFYQSDLLELPNKLAAWAQKIDYSAFPGNTPEQVQALVSSLYDVAFRLRDLAEARAATQAQQAEKHLLDDLDAWHRVLEARLQSRVDDPTQTGEASVDLRDRLAARLASIETGIVELFDRAGEDGLSSSERKDLFRLLGSYRGLSEAEIGAAQLAERINWAQWQEARF